jgi:hypothetical protein
MTGAQSLDLPTDQEPRRPLGIAARRPLENEERRVHLHYPEVALRVAPPGDLHWGPWTLEHCTPENQSSNGPWTWDRISVRDAQKRWPTPEPAPAPKPLKLIPSVGERLDAIEKRLMRLEEALT